MRLALFLILAALVTGCANLGRPGVEYMGDVRYPPTVTVERLRLEPNRPYEAIAALSFTSSAHTRRTAEDLLAEEARRLGADAVVFDPSVLTKLSSSSVVIDHQESYRYDAIAVRYLDR